MILEIKKRQRPIATERRVLVLVWGSQYKGPLVVGKNWLYFGR